MKAHEDHLKTPFRELEIEQVYEARRETAGSLFAFIALGMI